VSEAGSYAAITVASGLMARFGTAAATTAVAAGGATAGASAAGAGSGTLAGPVGTAVGLGVGLVVGLTIDWWMTDKFEQELSQKMRTYLDRLEQSILEGPVQSNGKSDRSAVNSNVGIKQSLPHLCDRLHDAYQQRFHQQIVQMENMP
jgi:phage tail tape-measure protein